MAIRNPKSHLNRHRGIRIEALEKRQLLAAISGAGEEYESDFLDSASGNTIDLVRMTGASLTIDSNDFHQITNISLFDLDGDLIYVQFSGEGRLVITLEDSSAQTLDPVLHAGLTGDYVKGQASFFIDASDADTYFAVFAVGADNDLGTDSAVTGVSGDGIANVTRLNIAANPLAIGGSLFAGIGMANVTFSGTSGPVGIFAPNIQVQQYVRIGDIDASDGALPKIVLGDNSTFATVTIHGGDLLQSNGSEIDFGGAEALELVAGITAGGVVQPAQDLQGVFEGSPTADDVSVTTDEDTDATGTLSGTDPDGDFLTFSVVSGSATNGSVSISGDAFTFTPDDDFFGTASFDYVANDGDFGSPAATVTITVTAINDAPTVGSVAIGVGEEGTVAGTFSGADVDGDDLAFSIVDNSATGSAIGAAVSIDGSSFTFTPADNVTGEGTFQFVANDGTVDSDAGTVTVTVTAENDAPTVVDDAVDSTTSTVTIAHTTLLANDSDAENDTITITGVGNAVGGAVADLGDGNIVFIFTDTSVNRTGTFDYTVSDGSLSTVGTVTVNFNTAPTVAAVAVTIVEDNDATDTLVGADVDGDTITISIVPDSATNGSVSLVGDVYTFTPTADFNGTATFDYIATDDFGSDSDPATVTITITQDNDAPSADDLDAGSVVAGGNVALTGTLTGADIDTDADLNQDPLAAAEVLNFAIDSDALAGGATVAITDAATGAFSITPGATQQPGDYSFTVSVTDAAGESDTPTVTFTVTNTAPTATDDNFSATTNTATVLDVLANDIDADVGQTLVVISVTQAVSGGNVEITNNGTDLTFTSTPGFAGTVSFTYIASDGFENAAAATVTVTVSAVTGGTSGNDVLQGTSAAEIINGLAGDDIIDGGGGADQIDGGEGDDTITIRGGLVNATGGLGNDTMVLAANTPIDSIHLDAPIDHDQNADDPVFTGNQNQSNLDGDVNPDNGEANRGELGGDDGPVLTAFENVDASAVNQIMTIFGDDNANILTGGNAGDKIKGQDGDDTIFGGPGNDLLKGGQDNDTLFGGDGDDTIKGGDGDDMIFGGPGDDGSSNSPGAQELNGSDGNDIVHGGDGDDYILNNDGGDDDGDGIDDIDMLFGDAGDDHIEVRSAGDDSEFYGGDGNDLIQIETDDDDFLIDGGADDDVIEFDTDTDLIGDNNDTIIGGTGRDELFFSGSDNMDLEAFLDGGGSVTEIDVLRVDSGFSITVGDDAVDQSDDNPGSITVTAGDTDTGNLTLSAAVTGDRSVEIATEGTVTLANVKNVVTIADGTDGLVTDGTETDVITGGDGDDVITLISDASDDTILTGAGEDTVTMQAGAAGDDTIDLGADDDTLNVAAIADITNADNISGGTGTDTVNFTTSANVDTGDLEVALSGFEAVNITGNNLLTVTDTFVDANGGDSVDVGSTTNAAFTLNAALTGGNVANITTEGLVTLDDVVNVVTISDDPGDDDDDDGGDVRDGTDLDTITGGSRDDTILLNQGGDDVVDTAGGDDTVTIGVAADHEVTLGTGDDEIIFLTNSHLDEKDIIVGGTGHDELYGQENADFDLTAFDFSNVSGIDEILIIGGSGNTLTIDNDVVAQSEESGGTSIDVGATGGGFILSAALTGGKSANIVTSETVTLADGVANVVTIDDDTDGNDNGGDVVGGTGDDTVTGSDDADTITLAGGTNILNAGDGDDIISIASGDDTVDAGAGADTVTLTAALDADDSISGGADDDTLVLQDSATFTSTEAAAVSSFETVEIPAQSQNIAITLVDGVGASLLTDDSSDIGTYTVTLSAGDLTTDLEVELSASNTDFHDITTGSGNDTINLSGNVAHQVDSGAGDDDITTGIGDDDIFVGSGDDTVLAGAGSDDIHIELSELDANDNLDFETGSNDELELLGGGTGTLAGFSNADKVELDDNTYDLTLTDAILDANNDFLIIDGTDIDDVGDENTLRVDASGLTSDGNDNTVRLRGGDFDDVLIGGDNADTIEGNAGDDTLTGNGGDDIITGGLGDDILTGGGGGDTFVYNAVGDSGIGSGNRDIITDFEIDVDTIDLVGLSLAGTPVFIGFAQFSADAANGEVRLNLAGDKVIIQVDVNADGAVQMEIEITGLITPSTSDFAF